MPASPSVLGALARALSISVTTLTDQPYLEELRQDQLDGLIQPIREALNIYDLGPDPDVVPRPLAELSETADQLCALVRATEIKRVAADLPALLHETTTTVHTRPSAQAWTVLASLYRTAYDITTKLGFPDLCGVALDRLEWAAQRASDPVLSGMRQYLRALAYFRASDYRTGKRLIALGMGVLDQAEPGRVKDVLQRQLHLGAAVLAGRDKDQDAAEEHLTEAERIATRTGYAEKAHWLSFGPTNVEVHRVSVLAELDLYPEAVTSAKAVAFPEGWPTSRLAHHYAGTGPGADVDRAGGRLVPEPRQGTQASPTADAVPPDGARDVRGARSGEAPDVELVQQLRSFAGLVNTHAALRLGPELSSGYGSSGLMCQQAQSGTPSSHFLRS